MSSPATHHHTIDRVFSSDWEDGPAWPMLAMFIILLCNQLVGNWIMRRLYACFPSLEIGDLQLDEDIDNYFVSLDDKDRNWAVEEDKYSTETLGLQIMTKKQKAALHNSESQRQ